MFTKFIIYFHLLKATDCFFEATAVVSIIFLLAIGVLYLVARWGGFYADGTNETIRNRFGKILKWLWAIVIISFILAVFLPNPKTILSYYALRQVDHYNIETPDSNLSSEEILGMIDKTLTRVENIIDKKAGSADK